jgi:hypothetical protein
VTPTIPSPYFRDELMRLPTMLLAASEYNLLSLMPNDCDTPFQ